MFYASTWNYLDSRQLVAEFSRGQTGESDVTRFAQTNMADKCHTTFEARGQRPRRRWSWQGQLSKYKLFPGNIYALLGSIANRVTSQEAYLALVSMTTFFWKRHCFGPETVPEIYQRPMFATWYTAICNLQGLYRTAGTKINSIHLHFQSLAISRLSCFRATPWEFLYDVTSVGQRCHRV